MSEQEKCSGASLEAKQTAVTVNKNVNVKMGRVIEIENTKRPKFSNANSRYFEILVEDENGRNEFPLIFTKAEIANALHRAARNPEDVLKRGWLQNLLD
jgi:hypothetical protein